VFFAANRALSTAPRVELGMMLTVACGLAAATGASIDMGGLASPAAPWCTLLPVTATMTLGRRVGGVSALLTAIALVAMHELGRDVPVIPEAELKIARLASAFSLLVAGTMIGMTDLLMHTKLDDAQRDYARTAREAAESLVGLVDDLLEISRLEAGGVILAPAPCDLVSLARGVVDLLALRAREKGLTLELDAPADLPRVIADAPRLRQVLTNFVDNAVKFTAQGRVTVRVRAEKRDGDRARVTLAVEDTGIGIAPENHELIFEKFRQADSSTTRRDGGTGLGLAIARELLALMGGTVSVTSTPGAGATFTATLDVSIAPPAASLEGTRALLAEDNAVNERLALMILAQLGCRVDVARNGEEAVRLASERPYDVVLMDCHMPEMDGYRAAAEIKQRHGSSLPILALTAAGSADDVRRAREAGMDALLEKPIDVEGIRGSLGRVVSPPAAVVTGKA
jgi:signal transduction histidine kinase/CheY-like chemotaxis protein